MKETLFRGQIQDNKKWIEGDLCQYTDGIFIKYNGNLPISKCSTGRYFKVKPSTVGQYIGYKDKNGTKIFKGNITKLVLSNGEVRYFEVDIRTVIRHVVNHKDFIDDTSKVSITGVVFLWNGFELFPCIDKNGKSDIEKMEVVGNIFDNPELLK